MKLNKFLTLFSFSLFLLLGSCDKNFEEINTDPNNPTDVPSNLLLAGTLRNTANRIQDTYLAGESPLCWVQQLSKPVYNDGDLYKPRLGSIQNLWDVFYSQVIMDAKVMKNLAVEEGNEKMQGVSLVVQAYSFQILTDAFGNIPFSEACQNGNFTPIYNTTMEVYTGIIEMLTEANTLLDGAGEIDASQDLLYGGNSILWKKYANSLKFRALMRISGSVDVSSQLQTIVDSGELFSSNDEEAKLLFLGADPNANPYYEGLVLTGRIEEWCMGENLVQMMDGTDTGVFDNRLEVYANLSEDGVYTGLPAGLSTTPTATFNEPLSYIGDDMLIAESHAFFMSYAQLNFLLAEAAEKLFISGGSTAAATYYAEGINASFQSVGADIGSYPTAYIGGSTGLAQIGKQSYIALFMQGYEAWAEYRRTGYPILTPAPGGVISGIPSRFSYPGDEQSDNAVNYSSAVNEQGPDLLTTPIAWMN